MSETHHRTGLLAAAGALASAVAASACCLLPLVLIAFGASAGGVSAWFEQYRPIFLTAALGLLGLGFYLVYRRPPACVPGSACETPRPKLRRFNQAMIWGAALLVAAFAFFPSYAVWFVAGTEPPASVSPAAASSETVALKIDGMTCEMCAVGLQNQFSQTPGVAAASVSYNDRTATVTLTDHDPATMEVLTATIEKAGYRVLLIP